MDTPNSTTKQCSKCKEWFPATLEHWHRRRKSKDGLCYICKQCAHKRAAKDYAENREADLARSHQWYVNNGEVARKRANDWYYANKERAQARSRAYYAQNKTTLVQRAAEYQRGRRELLNQRAKESRKANPEPRRAASRAWHKNHPEKSRALRARRRGPDSFTAADIRAQYTSQKGRCWWCGKKVGEKYHVDHVLPLAKGGTNDPRNIVISCPDCNLSKGKKLPQEWIGRLF